MKMKLTIASLGALGVASFAIIFFTVKADGQMVFPKKPHGEFIRSPTIISKEATPIITWVLPVRCENNSYEVQEVGYEPASGKLWGGSEASCAKTENGFECRAEVHPEMGGKASSWRIQSLAYGCEGGDYFISDVIDID